MDINAIVSEAASLLDSEVVDYYRTHGKYIGNGLYSTAFKYHDYCVKLGGDMYNPSHVDNGGNLWAKWCVDHQHLACVPRVYYYKELTQATNVHYIVVMELLEKEYGTDIDMSRHAIDIGDIQYAEENGAPVYILEFMTEFEDVRGVACMDLHQGNVMLRESTGELVVIDPFSGVSVRS